MLTRMLDLHQMVEAVTATTTVVIKSLNLPSGNGVRASASRLMPVCRFTCFAWGFCCVATFFACGCRAAVLSRVFLRPNPDFDGYEVLGD